MPNYIKPDWPAPTNVKAYTSTRDGGVSQGAYRSFNLAQHVGDQPTHVQQNRELLKQNLNLPNDPYWLKQTHSTTVVDVDYNKQKPNADAAITEQPQHICAVLTADCLPLLICNQQGTEVGAIHAGWRGLLAGAIDATIHRLTSPAEQLLVWLGPAISQSAMDVDNPFREQFIKCDPNYAKAFKATENAWRADLYAIARRNLQRLGVRHIFGGQYCTVKDPQFFSYRGDQETSGRMVSLIWLA